MHLHFFLFFFFKYIFSNSPCLVLKGTKVLESVIIAGSILGSYGMTHQKFVSHSLLHPIWVSIAYALFTITPVHWNKYTVYDNYSKT